MRHPVLVARAARALAVAGLFDMHGHISVRDGDTLYINDRLSSRTSVTPDHVARVRIADGTALSGEPPSETPLHVAVYRARKDAGSVAHFHPLYATAFAVAGRPLVTAYCAGVYFGPVVPVYDDPDLIRTDEQGQAMADAMGAHTAVLLRGHGAVVWAADVPSCVTASLYLEELARRLAATVPLGEPKPFSADELRRVRESAWHPKVVAKAWRDAVERARLAGRMDDLPEDES